MRAAVLLGSIVLGVTALAGCGESSGRLDDRVAAVRSAVDSGDRAAAEQALDELGFAAGVAVDDGSISQSEGDEIALLVESSRSLLDQVVPTSTTTSTSTSTTTTSTPPPEQDEDEGDKDEEDEGRGEKKGRDKGDDDDKDDDD